MTSVGGIREDANLEFRAEFFNLFNHPQFSNPVAALQCPELRPDHRNFRESAVGAISSEIQFLIGGKL